MAKQTYSFTFDPYNNELTQAITNKFLSIMDLNFSFVTQN